MRYIQRVDADGITVGTFDNVASTTTVGTDLNVTYKAGALTLFTGGSAYHYSSDAANQEYWHGRYIAHRAKATIRCEE